MFTNNKPHRQSRVDNNNCNHNCNSCAPQQHNNTTNQQLNNNNALKQCGLIPFKVHITCLHAVASSISTSNATSQHLQCLGSLGLSFRPLSGLILAFIAACATLGISFVAGLWARHLREIQSTQICSNIQIVSNPFQSGCHHSIIGSA